MKELNQLKPLAYSFGIISVALILYYGMPIGNDTVKNSSYIDTDTVSLHKGRSHTSFVYRVELSSGKVINLSTRKMQGPSRGDKVNKRLSLLSFKTKYYLAK